ncbi:hypothetical protein ID866_11841, partial [Astraeus odoratus]
MARTDAIHEAFSKENLQMETTRTLNGHATDGDMSVDGHCYVIAKMNEVCSSNADPYYQAILYYLESTRSYAARLNSSSLPCIIVLFFGPYISFAGAVWNMRPTIQPLSVTLPMHYHPTDTNMQMKVACHLGAFKKAAHTLEEYYKNLLTCDSVSIMRYPQLFPYPMHFSSLQDNERHDFAFLSQPYQDRLIFFGILRDGHYVCIKFVHQYSADAHKECASLGYAPMLRGFEELPGGWFMVVMDRLPLEEYDPFCNIRATASLIDNIRDALRKLHAKGYIHGNIRNGNILVSNSDKAKFMLVDFDCAGEIGKVRYPMNRDNLWWPNDAVEGTLITTKHDMDMLDAF